MKIRIFKKAVYAAAILGVVFCVSSIKSAYSEELKIGYIDSQKILDNSIRGKEVKETLNEYVQSRQKIVEIEESDLKKLQDDISKQGAILNPDSKKEKEELFQKKFMEYQKKVNELQKEIQQRRAEILEEFNNELGKVVRTLGEKEGYSIIFNNLEVNIVLFAKSSLDLTKHVTEEMDKNSKKEDKGKK